MEKTGTGKQRREGKSRKEYCCVGATKRNTREGKTKLRVEVDVECGEDRNKEKGRIGKLNEVLLRE